MKDKRERLLEAAKELLWEVGYDEMTPAMLMTRGSAGQGSLYHHFDGKLGVAQAALEEVSKEEMAAIDELFGSSVDPLACIERYLQSPRDAMKGCRLGRLLHESVALDRRIREPIERYLSHVEDHLAAALEKAQKNGQIRSDVDLRHVAAALLACVQGSYNLARANMQVSKMNHSLAGTISLLRSLQSPLLPAARKRKPHARKSAKEFAEATASRTRLRRRTPK
jgi:TetR/AcrR family transcriptional regulator, transcriptional repressor for nem operon